MMRTGRVKFVGTMCLSREESKLNKNYDAVDIIDMVEEAVGESIRQDDTAEHDGAIYNMKANVFKHLAIAEHERNQVWEGENDE